MAEGITTVPPEGQASLPVAAGRVIDLIIVCRCRCRCRCRDGTGKPGARVEGMVQDIGDEQLDQGVMDGGVDCPEGGQGLRLLLVPHLGVGIEQEHREGPGLLHRDGFAKKVALAGAPCRMARQ
jgi:hypothetical protein